MTRTIEITNYGGYYRVTYTDVSGGNSFVGVAEDPDLKWAMKAAENYYYSAVKAYQEMMFGADRTSRD